MLGDVVSLLKTVGSSDEAKAQAMSALFFALTGSAPQIQRGTDVHGAFVKVMPTEAQAEILRAHLENWMAKDPSGFRVDLSRVWRPLMIKKSIPWAVGIGALAYLGGKAL